MDHHKLAGAGLDSRIRRRFHPHRLSMVKRGDTRLLSLRPLRGELFDGGRVAAVVDDDQLEILESLGKDVVQRAGQEDRPVLGTGHDGDAGGHGSSIQLGMVINPAC